MAIQLDEVMIFCISIGSLLFGTKHISYTYILSSGLRHMQASWLHYTSLYPHLKVPKISRTSNSDSCGVHYYVCYGAVSESSCIKKHPERDLLRSSRNSSCSNWIYPLQWYARWCYCLLLHHLDPLYLTQKVIYFLQTLTGDSFIVRSRLVDVKSVLIRYTDCI